MIIHFGIGLICLFIVIKLQFILIDKAHQKMHNGSYAPEREVVERTDFQSVD